ncbi:MAG: FadR family transcriptional regulator [Loktanella sp.]|nr:FadR family transcriptional regulator [Loktanella sp.]
METKPDIADEDDELVAALRAGLVSNALTRNGRMISERALAIKMDVSRARLRRALSQLEQDGDIFRRQGQGTFVLPPPLTHAPRVRSLAAAVTPRDVMEVRLEIEPALAAFAAERAPAESLRQLEGLCAATKKQPSADAFEIADDIFHYKIAQMAENPLFLSIYEEIRAVRRQAAWTKSGAHRKSVDLLDEAHDQHNDICTAIVRRDAQGAASAMHRHLLFVLNSRLRSKWGNKPS